MSPLRNLAARTTRTLVSMSLAATLLMPGSAGAAAGGTPAPGSSAGAVAPLQTTTNTAPTIPTSVPNTAATTPNTPATTPTATTPLFAPATPAGTPSSAAQDRARKRTHSSTSKLSTPAIALAALAALLALCCAAWGIARLLAFEPRWTLSLRHAMAEAGFRMSATWAELTDWIRLGH